MKKYVIGIDVGGTKILYGVFDNRMNLLRVIQRATDQELTPDQMMRQMTSNVQGGGYPARGSAGHRRGLPLSHRF